MRRARRSHRPRGCVRRREPRPFLCRDQAARKLAPTSFPPPQRASKDERMKINAIDIKPGFVLEHQGKLWIVLRRELVQPGKGGSFAQVEMRDLRGGSKLNERFRTQETVERVRLDEKKKQCRYTNGDDDHSMDNKNYGHLTRKRMLIGSPANF